MINRTQEEIMQDWGVDNSDTPLVSVRCITFYRFIILGIRK